MWWLFAPPFLVAALHQWLGTRAEAWPSLHALKAVPVMNQPGSTGGITDDVLWQSASGPLLLMVIGITAVVLGRRHLRRIDTASLRRWALPVWAALCGLGAAGVVVNHLNLAWRASLPDVQATVLQARLQTPNPRSPGGLKLVLIWPGSGAPQRGLLEGEHLRTLLPGRTVTVQRVRGAWWGEYLSGIAELGSPTDAQSR